MAHRHSEPSDRVGAPGPRGAAQKIDAKLPDGLHVPTSLPAEPNRIPQQGGAAWLRQSPNHSEDSCCVLRRSLSNDSEVILQIFASSGAQVEGAPNHSWYCLSSSVLAHW